HAAVVLTVSSNLLSLGFYAHFAPLISAFGIKNEIIEFQVITVTAHNACNRPIKDQDYGAGCGNSPS
ncbi:hypothetical protein, partial [Vibrio cholerae]|uniref:hypothetical protein n=1 Tax=Vibrio cholerae TaxID=666 RepID=UPI001965CE66